MTSIADRIKTQLEAMAYDRGHASGEAEIQSILDGLLWDFFDIIADVRLLELRYEELCNEQH